MGRRYPKSDAHPIINDWFLTRSEPTGLLPLSYSDTSHFSVSAFHPGHIPFQNLRKIEIGHGRCYTLSGYVTTCSAWKKLDFNRPLWFNAPVHCEPSSSVSNLQQPSDAFPKLTKVLLRIWSVATFFQMYGKWFTK